MCNFFHIFSSMDMFVVLIPKVKQILVVTFRRYIKINVSYVIGYFYGDGQAKQRTGVVTAERPAKWKEASLL